MQKEGVSVEVGAEATIKGVKISSGITTETEKVQASKYSTARKSSDTHSVGSIPPADGSVATWTQQTFNSPAPIYLELEPIELVVQRALGNDANHLVLQTLKKALSQYCPNYLRDAKHLAKDCDKPKPNVQLTSENSCRLCSRQCGSGYDADGGSILMDSNWPSWTQSFGPACSDNSYG